jgi:2-hydroxy-3-oxopropionate reductase
MDIHNIGVIGLGIIGKPIAERLVKAGFRVHVYDVRDEPVAALKAFGAIACTSSEDVARHSELIISLVLDGAQTDDVVSGPAGILKSIKPGTIFATGSTLGPGAVRRIAAALVERGCATLDMPITGGYLAAHEGKLVLMIGAEPNTLERARPVLCSFAHIITYAGSIGAGQSAKLAHQLIMSINIMALLEGLSLGVSGGVDPVVLKKIIRDGIANSAVLELWDDMGPRWKSMLVAAEPGTPLPNMRKDLHSAQELARELGVDLFLGSQASLIADAGIATGHDNPSL